MQVARILASVHVLDTSLQQPGQTSNFIAPLSLSISEQTERERIDFLSANTKIVHFVSRVETSAAFWTEKKERHVTQ